MNNTKEQVSLSYYGASNGYYGFKSLFGEVFNPENFTHIYVIKGGPGTGKSTLMRKIHSYFKDLNVEIEEIFCSSDPASLDGIILKREDEKVALLDGTSPHETDAKYPGAKDEIINLGEGFDKKKLISNREKILTICKNKAAFYKQAYFYLSLVGKIHLYISALAEEKFDFSSVRKLINRYFTPRSEETAPKKYFLSSFGAKGRTILQPVRRSKNIKIDGNGYTEELFSKIMYNDGDLKYDLKGVFLSCFNYKVLEGAASEDTVMMQGLAEYTDSINANEYCKFNFENVSDLIKTEDKTLSMANEAFILASKEHFKLEEIYKNAVNFDKNDEILEKLKSEIKDFLSLS